MKVAWLVLSLIAAAPHGAALAAPTPTPTPTPAETALPAPPVDAPAEAAPPPDAPAEAAPPPDAPAEAAPPAAAAVPMAAPMAVAPPVAVRSVAEPIVAPTLGPPSTMVPEAPPSNGKSPLIAFSLSFSMPIAAVLASVYLLGAGDPSGGAGAALLVVAGVAGPSTGWYYAGRPLTALATTGVRLAGGLMAIQVLDDRPGRSTTVPMLGMALFAAATLVDWFGPVLTVAQDNARGGPVVVPAAMPGGGAGFAIGGAF